MLALMFGVISMGDIERYNYDGVPGGELKRIDYNIKWRFTMIFFVPILTLWISMIVTMGEFIVSTSASIWYFSKDKHVLLHPVSTALGNVVKYHMGSLVVASILVPLCRPVKAVLGWLKGCVRNHNNCCCNTLLCCCCCCLNLHEMIFKFLHSDTITYIAIWGDGFLTSGRKAYFLKERSMEKVKSLSYAGEFLVWITTLVISLSGPCFCLYWILYQDESFFGE
jgi:hypothetical protein